MKRMGWILLIALVLSTGVAETQGLDGLGVSVPGEATAPWARWLAAEAPVAMLAWASWAPRAGQVIDRLPEIENACQSRGLRLVVVAVQEPLEDSSAALGAMQTPWLHDRHGSLLKRYRVIRVPSIAVLGSNGEVMGELEASPDAIRSWQRP